MRKIKRKRKPTVLAYGIVLLIFSFGIYMLSSLYLKQYNNQVSFKIQSSQRQIQVLATENEALKVEIDELTSKSIVLDTAKGDDMEIDRDRVIYISKKDE